MAMQKHVTKILLPIVFVISILTSGYFSRSYSKIESSMVTLILLEKPHAEKNERIKNIDTLFNSNLFVIKSFRGRIFGGVIYKIVKAANSSRARLFSNIESEYLK